MEKVIITPALEAEFQGYRSPMEVCDTQGKSVGFFLPSDTYKRLLAKLEIPYSADELARRRQEQGGNSLQEFWERMTQP